MNCPHCSDKEKYVVLQKKMNFTQTCIAASLALMGLAICCTCVGIPLGLPMMMVGCWVQLKAFKSQCPRCGYSATE